MNESIDKIMSINHLYQTGMAQGSRQSLPALERAHRLIFDFRCNVNANAANLSEAQLILESEIRRIKGLPF